MLPKQANGLERLTLAHSPRFQALLEESRQSVRAGQGVPHAEFWKTVQQRRRGAPAGKGKK
jgi:hypothetical protein